MNHILLVLYKNRIMKIGTRRVDICPINKEYEVVQQYTGNELDGKDGWLCLHGNSAEEDAEEVRKFRANQPKSDTPYLDSIIDGSAFKNAPQPDEDGKFVWSLPKVNYIYITAEEKDNTYRVSENCFKVGDVITTFTDFGEGKSPSKDEIYTVADIGLQGEQIVIDRKIPAPVVGMRITRIASSKVEELPKSYVEQFLDDCRHPEGMYLQTAAASEIENADREWFLGFCSQLELLVEQSKLVKQYVDKIKTKQ